jgi:hypothetical protein
MEHSKLSGLLVLALLWGCSSPGTFNEFEYQARKHIVLADSLERVASLRESLLEYRLVAERYPSSTVYEGAVLKTALLYSDPENPAANDSASLFWFNRYLTLTPMEGEKQIIRMYLETFDHTKTLRDSLRIAASTNDSLVSTIKRQTGDAAARIKRVQELESELQRASLELKKLKEVDLRISKSRGKKKE